MLTGAAGIPLHRIAGSNTSVYVGSMAREYDALIQKDPERFGKYTATGTAPSMLANRLSWFYDLRGPSLTLDTACSSGLYALYLACQDLANNSTAMVTRRAFVYCILANVFRVLWGHQTSS